MTSTQTKRQKLATSTVSAAPETDHHSQQQANEQSSAPAACPKAELATTTTTTTTNTTTSNSNNNNNGQSAAHATPAASTPALTNNNNTHHKTARGPELPATRASSRRPGGAKPAPTGVHFALEVDELGDDDDDDNDEDDDDDDDDDDEDDDEDDDDEEEDDEDEDETEDDDDEDEEEDRARKRRPSKRHNGGHLFSTSSSSSVKPKAKTRTSNNSSNNSNNKSTTANNSTSNRTNSKTDASSAGHKARTSTSQAGGHTAHGDQSALQASIQEQLAASGPAGVAAAAAIATARKRKRAHTFETNPSVRKRQQTRLIRKLRQCIDEYTARVGQQAVVLITMPGKAANNFKVFGAQPLESVVRACKQEIMVELEQAVLEQTPVRPADQDESGKHELPPLVIDGIPTPVEKMTQAQLRAFIPLMLKYSTGRGKPGWGKESTRPPWWPGTLPWANVRSDARDDDEKQRISWTTTLREIVTNCYTYHGREDLLPKFDESAEGAGGPAGSGDEPGREQAHGTGTGSQASAAGLRHQQSNKSSAAAVAGAAARPLGSASTRSSQRLIAQQHHQQQQQLIAADQLQHLYTATVGSGAAAVYGQAAAAGGGGGEPIGQPFMHTIQNPDGSVSLIQVDPANAQILTLPDGTQVRAVRLQTLASNEPHHQHHHQLIASGAEPTACLDPTGQTVTLQLALDHQQQQQHQSATATMDDQEQQQQLQEGQIILTSEDGTQSCYPMSSLVSIPASVYQQFAATGQPIQIVAATAAAGATADGQLAGLHSLQEISAAEAQLVEQQQQQQVEAVERERELADGGGGQREDGLKSESTGGRAANGNDQKLAD